VIVVAALVSFDMFNKRLLYCIVSYCIALHCIVDVSKLIEQVVSHFWA